VPRVTRDELIAEREQLGDALALALGHLDAILERLNADLTPSKPKANPKTKKAKGSK
jgi:hypothetical protein